MYPDSLNRHNILVTKWNKKTRRIQHIKKIKGANIR